MVNNRTNVGKWQGTPPPEPGEDRKISGGPLYSLDDLEPLLAAGKVALWTKDCAKDAANLGFDLDDVAALIREAIVHGRYIDSEWCQGKPTGPWAACDAYSLRRTEWNEFARRDLTCDYFVKFAIGKTGNVVITISCHTSN
ncbi:hypothetical protein BPS26883_04671 [Burkholderia pseudomultivorans]|uniref:Uncharacterized protein n=1 Tax=Burkholderia pseudomultivorans TaxID=1207504 RepID=A0A6P2NPH9_9BURK|nr:hypothetical protein BPS26883_04671 [Burkholderia pseudomultivorans]